MLVPLAPVSVKITVPPLMMPSVGSNPNHLKLSPLVSLRESNAIANEYKG